MALPSIRELISILRLSGPRGEAARFGLALAAGAFVVALLLPAFGVFEKLELATFDQRLRLRGARPVHPGIFILEIDQTTIREYKNAWPIARDQYALLLNDLRERGVRTIGIDLLFVGPDRIQPESPDEPTNDQILAAVIARDPRVINGVYFSLYDPSGAARGTEDLADSTRLLWQRFTIPVPTGVRLMRSVDSNFDLEPTIAESTAFVGHVGLYQDIDGVSRALPLLVEHKGRAFPALSLVMAANYLGADWRQIRFENGYAVLPHPGGVLRIPVDRNGRVAISFPGDAKVFKNHKTFLEVLNEVSDRTAATPAMGKTPPPEASTDPLRDKVVLVCNTATALAISDFGPTPFGPNSPLAYAHASVLNSILQNDYIREVPLLVQYGAWLATAIFLGLLLSVMAPIPLALTTLATIVVYFMGSLLATSLGGYQTAFVPPVLMILVIAVGNLGRGYFVRDLQRRAQEQELAVARRIQQGLLPKDVLRVNGVEVAGVNLPCFAVGGDYFDYFPMSDGRIALAIADVSGKGVPAALLMSNLQAIFRAECARGASVALVPEQANRQLMESMAGNSKFVTFFYGALDASAGRLAYSNAGHNPPLVVRKDGAIEELATGGLLLGVFPLATYDVGEVDLGAGDVVVLFTDGVTEAESTRHDLYGDERLHELVRRVRDRSAREIGEEICRDVERYSHGLHQSDDVTIVIVKVKDGDGAHATNGGVPAEALGL
jgi:CHASE2 domain-containing sensor protein